jgi:4-hydroxy-4-methyl-2-oxoglutarate aldolase
VTSGKKANGPRARLTSLDTPALSDALDRLGVDGQAIGIAAIDRSSQLVGRAYTVRMLPRGLSGKSVGDYIDDVQAGDVVVIDNQGRLDATVWGDILTTVAHRNGVAGTVIDGVCRDVQRAAELDFPIYARAHTMRTGKDRVAAEAYQQPVQLAGIRVEPGDWLRGDADGIVVVPALVVEEVLAAAEEIAATEDRIRDATRDGGRLDRIRADFNYHQLQTRPADHG